MRLQTLSKEEALEENGRAKRYRWHISGNVPDVCLTGNSLLGQVDGEPLQFHCKLEVVFVGGKTRRPMSVGTILDSGSGITCTCDRLAQRLKANFPGEQLIFHFRWDHSTMLADKRTLEGTLRVKHAITCDG